MTDARPASIVMHNRLVKAAMFGGPRDISVGTRPDPVIERPTEITFALSRLATQTSACRWLTCNLVVWRLGSAGLNGTDGQTSRFQSHGD